MDQQIHLEVEFESTPQESIRPQYQSNRSNDGPGTIRRPVILCVVCILTFNTQKELDAHRGQKHFYCQICDRACKKCYRNQAALERHRQKAHSERWCDYCRRLFDKPADKSHHVNFCHPQCKHCSKFSKSLPELSHHIAATHPDRIAAPAVGEYYALLNVRPTASHEEILRAARTARVAAHPDRRTRSPLSDQCRAHISHKAKEVGRAADVLCDVRQRLEYDSQLKYGREV